MAAINITHQDFSDCLHWSNNVAGGRTQIVVLYTWVTRDFQNVPQFFEEKRSQERNKTFQAVNSSIEFEKKMTPQATKKNPFFTGLTDPYFPICKIGRFLAKILKFYLKIVENEYFLKNFLQKKSDI